MLPYAMDGFALGCEMNREASTANWNDDARKMVQLLLARLFVPGHLHDANEPVAVATKLGGCVRSVADPVFGFGFG